MRHVVFICSGPAVYTKQDVQEPPCEHLRASCSSVGTWLSLVERTLGVGEVASSNLVVPTIYLSAHSKRTSP